MATSSPKRFPLLSNGLRVHDVADACRSAALAFMAGTNAGWSRRDLAFWLVRDYANAVGGSAASARRRKTVLPALAAPSIELLLLRSRESVLARLVAGDLRTLAVEMVDGGLVVGVRDEIDAMGYAPVERPDLCLFDRVASLCAADYLTRPADYASVVACEDCGEVSFAWAEVHCGPCERQPVLESTIVPRYESAWRGVG